MNLPEFSVKRAVSVTMLILIMVVLGVISLTRLGLDLMPDVTYPAMAVVTRYSGVAPEDVENLVTRPIEEVVGMVKGVKKINSKSQEGLSSLIVEFVWGTNLDFAAQDIRDKIDLIKDYLPQEISKPMVVKFDPSTMPLGVYGFTGNRDLAGLKALAEDLLKDRLEQIDGVASVMVWGGWEKEILISVNRRRMEAYGLSLPLVLQKLQMENFNVPGGHLVFSYQDYLLRSIGEFKNLEEIKNLALLVKGGIPVYLKDIAEVKESYKEKTDYARTNQRESVMLMIFKESQANTVLVTNRLDKELKKLEKQFPPDIELDNFFNQSEIIKRITRATSSNAWQGGVLAILILWLFLQNWRPTLTIAFSIPLSIIITFIPLYFFGFTLNFITLMGLALGVGMMVDNSIVVIENTFRHLTEGKDRYTAARLGASEVGMAISSSTLTTIVVFLPLVFVGGFAGKLFQGLAASITFSLLASLLVAVTIVPMLASKIFKPPKKGFEAGYGQQSFEKFKGIYRSILVWVLGNPKKVLLTAGIMLILSLLLLIPLKKEYFPAMDNTMLSVMVKMPVGTELEETNRVIKMLEGIFKKEEGIKTIGAFVGLAQGRETDAAMESGSSGVNEGELFVRLEDKKQRKHGSQEIIESIRGKVPKIEGVKVDFVDMGRMMMGGGSGQKPVNIKIFGKDLAVLKELSRNLLDRMKDIKGLTDIDTTLVEAKPELKIYLDREKAARFGITALQFGQSIQTAMEGKVATRLHYAGEEVDIRVRLQEEDRQTVKDLKNLLIPTPLGYSVRLGDVARLEISHGPIKLARENQKRTISVTANVTSQRDLGRIIKDIKKVLSTISFPEGYFTELAGEAEQMRETFTALAQMFAFALLLIYMVMAAQFESLVHPFIIMFTVPLSIIGVILFVFISGKSICLPSGMGVLILAGVIVNNAIVLVDYINQLRREGTEKKTAIVQGSVTRLRPVLMTALTTILGLLPMALSRAEGSEPRSAMAVSLMGGLVVGTFLTLLIIPLIYNIFDRWTENLKIKVRRLLHSE